MYNQITCSVINQSMENKFLAFDFSRAVLRNALLKSATEIDVIKEAMVWLRNASDRNGGRKKMSINRATEAAVTI